jgi:hypothetical protein
VILPQGIELLLIACDDETATVEIGPETFGCHVDELVSSTESV